MNKKIYSTYFVRREISYGCPLCSSMFSFKKDLRNHFKDCPNKSLASLSRIVFLKSK